ncbi:hypothetical protein MNB_SM-6-1082 [hydrothermal vent metagenome]|uniref:Uncharacterized protein n=1 Tax=hydrothermal vent metagenome TaxID=652676 RepID=A0A1W1CT15_9ZZZZ
MTIASLNESNDDYQEFNGTVCATVDNNISKLLFNDQNSSTATFTIQNALKDIRVHLSWKKDVDENCPLTDEDNETNTTDNFAVRPEKFLITGNSASIFAGDDFNLSFNALDADGSDTDDYNETTANASFTIEANSTKAGCINGTLHIDDINFTNGVASDINTTYSNIGDVNITIKDSNDSSSFAYVDHDDTNESQRLISPATASIYVKPYELNITDVSFQPSTDKDWLYMADNINDMNITLDTIVKAFNKQGDILQDFNETCYAQDVNVTFYYDLNNSNSDINLTLDGNLTSNDVNISDINKTLQIPKKLFIDGEANSSYAFGIDRNYYDYKNPVNVVLKDVNVTTQNISKELQGKLLESDNNATFYFARTYTQDLATSQSSDTTKAEILIYSDHPLKDDNNVSLQEELLNWYLNTMHTDNSFGNITNTTPSKSIQKSATTDITTSAASITNGISTIEVNTTNDTKGSYFIHLDENRWLWYVAQNFGSDYNDSDNSKCTEHPCIKYTYEQKSLGHAVKSGTTTGVHFESSDVNVSKNNQGVRLFR